MGHKPPRIRAVRFARPRPMAEQMELKLWEDVRLEPTQVEWIVNDLAELGVRIGGRCYFLYKGRSMEYPDGEYAEGTPVMEMAEATEMASEVSAMDEATTMVPAAKGDMTNGCDSFGCDGVGGDSYGYGDGYGAGWGCGPGCNDGGGHGESYGSGHGYGHARGSWGVGDGTYEG